MTGRPQIDAIGGARFDDGAGGDNEVQRTMLEIVNQLDGFDSRGNIKVPHPPLLVHEHAGCPTSGSPACPGPQPACTLAGPGAKELPKGSDRSSAGRG